MTEPTAIERAKLALIDGVDRAILANYPNYHRAAHALAMDINQIYRLRTRNPSLFSLAWLIDTADRLGARVQVNVEVPPRNLGTLSQNSLESPSTSVLRIAGASRN